MSYTWRRTWHVVDITTKTLICAFKTAAHSEDNPYSAAVGQRAYAEAQRIMGSDAVAGNWFLRLPGS